MGGCVELGVLRGWVKRGRTDGGQRWPKRMAGRTGLELTPGQGGRRSIWAGKISDPVESAASAPPGDSAWARSAG